MRLMFLPVNDAWAFFFGDILIDLEGFPRFFNTLKEAKDAADYRGLAVTRRASGVYDVNAKAAA